jgi:hypothetical protein
VSVELAEQPDLLRVLVDGEGVASAWAAGDGRWWFLAAPGERPYRVDSRQIAARLLADVREQFEWRERSRWLPGHPEPGPRGFVHGPPAGVVCLGCGDDIAGQPFIDLVDSTSEPFDRHYICGHCHVWLDDDEDEN